MNDLFERLFGFTFADPWMLAFLILVPLALLVRARRKKPAVATGTGPLFEGLPGSWRTRSVRIPPMLHALGAALAVTALARPVVRERVPLRAEGIDILLAVDISSSMLATDMDPAARRSRLDVVKETARRFVEGRANDRIGLLLFAAYPEIRCPLTLDRTALEKFLADVRSVPPRSEEDRTGIGLGVARAASVLRGSEARSKVVILLTDGQENVWEIPPEEAAKLAKDFGIRVYTIVAGRDAPSFFGLETLDFTEAKKVAEMTGAKFFRAEDADALRETYTEIDRLEKTALKDPRSRFHEKFEWLLVPALALLALAWLLEGLALREAP